MGAVFFYHMTETPLEATLPVLLEKCADAGWRVAIRGRDVARLEWLDKALWKGHGFAPHGISGGPHDARQPVLLTLERAANDPACWMSVDGAEIGAAEAEAAERVCILFDGLDDGAVETARSQWRSLTGAGLSAQYWAQDAGRWVKKAET